MSTRVSFSEDSALWIAAVGNTLLGLGAVPFALYGALMIGALAEGGDDWLLLVALVPVVLGVALLVGYWKALRWSPRRMSVLWWTSLAYNVGVIAVSVASRQPMFLFLAAWGLFMCILSGYRALGYGPLAEPAASPS